MMHGVRYYVCVYVCVCACADEDGVVQQHPRLPLEIWEKIVRNFSGVEALKLVWRYSVPHLICAALCHAPRICTQCTCRVCRHHVCSHIE